MKTPCKKQSSNPSPAADILSRVVLVGTYKGDQLKNWPGWYCWPLDAEEPRAKSAKSAKVGRDSPTARPQGQANTPGEPQGLRRVTELWLFQGTKAQKTYKAEFVGVKTRAELVRDYGYPATGKPHGSRYALFKTELLYRHKNALQEEAAAVIIRTKDFAKRSPKIAKQLKTYLESPDRHDPDLAKLLPSIITKLPQDRLRVYETPVQLQLDFFPVVKPIVDETNPTIRRSFHCNPVVVRQVPQSAMSTGEIQDRIFQGDCLQILPKFPASSVDMILSDLPYGSTQNRWDSVIPLDLLWNEYIRVLKPNGTVVLTSQGIFTANLVLSNPEWFKYKLVWVKSKPTNFLNAKIQPLRKHEDVCVFYDRHSTYNPVMSEGVPYDKGVRKKQLSGSYGDFRPVHVQSNGKRYPTDVIYFKTAESEGEVWHPTQKPVELGRYLIKTFSNPGDLVLDNAFGSGSFLLAAALEGRHFAGIEKNEHVTLFKDKTIDYIDVAAFRLNEISRHKGIL